MKKYKVNVNGTVYEVTVELMDGAAPVAAAPAAAAPAPAPAAPAAQTSAIPNRQAMIAAIAVAIAEDLGTDPSGIRILSVKKL